MCGRFSYHDSSLIAEQYEINTDITFQSKNNVFPQSYIPVITDAYKLNTITSDENRTTRKLELMKWGLLPQWAKPETHKGFINARSETLHEKKSFKESFIFKRCIIPAKGFYEWSNTKEIYFISTGTDKPIQNNFFAFAGIWNINGLSPSVTIITTASDKISYIHERVPVIFNTKAQIDAWLSPIADLASLQKLLLDSNDSILEPKKIFRIPD